jgi:hypothetical protein
MSLYIPGCDLPKEGNKLLVIFPDGVVNEVERGTPYYEAKQLSPHGRLGDLDELEFYFDESAEGLHGTPRWAEIFRECAKAVSEAKTIIPADPEGGADNA